MKRICAIIHRDRWILMVTLIFLNVVMLLALAHGCGGVELPDAPAPWDRP